MAMSYQTVNQDLEAPSVEYSSTASVTSSAPEDKSFPVPCLCTSIGLVLILYFWGWVAPHHWKYDESSHLHYLDTWGIGAAIGGFYVIAIDAYAWAGRPTAETTPVSIEDWIKGPTFPSSAGLDQADLEDCISLSWMRWFNFLVMLGTSLLNMACIGHNFISLPQRDPGEPLNQAKHIVAWVEFPVMLIVWFWFMVWLWVQPPNAAKALPILSEYSILKSIPRANPMKLMEVLQKLYKSEGLCAALGTGVFALVMVPAAIMSVLVKIAQVDFVTKQLYWDWTPWNYLQLAGFINNIASLGPNQTAARIDAVLAFLDMKNPTLPEQWIWNLRKSLLQHYGGVKGFILACSITAEDVLKLLNENNR